MSTPFIKCRGLTRTYTRGEERITPLEKLDLEIDRGCFVALMGPSGSGKSTLFNMIGGLDKPTEGRVYIDEVDIAQLDAYELAWLRCRKIGYIFQSFNLIPVLTAQENVELPLSLTSLSKKERCERAEFALELVGIADRASHRPGQLSGGQEQRVAIARAMVTDPLFLLADEPTGNVDDDERLALLHRFLGAIS